MAEIDIRSNLSQEEKDRLARIDKLDSNKKRKKIIIAAVTVILISFFISGTVFGGIYILSYEGTQALPEAPKNYYPLPDNENAVFTSFAQLTAETKNYSGTKLDVSVNVNIPDESIYISGDTAESVRPLFSYVKPSVVSLISAFYDVKRVTGEYGTDFSEILYSTDFDKNDANAEFIVNENNDNEIQYIFTFPENDFEEGGRISEVFSTDIAPQVINGIAEKLSSMVKLTDITTDYKSFVISSDILRDKNIINSVSLKKLCNVKCTLEFIGEYSSFGVLELSFDIEISENHRFTRAEMFFTQDVFYVTKGASDEIKTKIISDESPADCVITYTSSDPDILSVDGRFFKANKVSDKPVTVTAEYSYNGVVYRDECEFYVIIPVEGVKQNEKDITLKKGESRTLGITISPDDATLTRVYWFSTDENIVTVDENGVINAISAGSASVYCITLDGNYKSSCSVAVSE